MSTYSLEKLLSLWRSEALTAEQIAGHLLQHIIAQEKRIALLEKGQTRSKTNPPDQEKEEGKAA